MTDRRYERLIELCRVLLGHPWLRHYKWQRTYIPDVLAEMEVLVREYDADPYGQVRG